MIRTSGRIQNRAVDDFRLKSWIDLCIKFHDRYNEDPEVYISVGIEEEQEREPHEAMSP